MDNLAVIIREIWVVWMLLLFVGIVVWAYWPSRRRRFQEMAYSILDEDPAPRPAAPPGSSRSAS